jgi:xanthine dehydrogenase accessory factor
MLDYRVVVADPEGMFKNTSDVDLHVTDPDLKGVKIDSNTAVVVSTTHKHDHKYIKAALDGGAWYIGSIASQKRAAIVLDTLARMGVDEKSLQRVISPAGIDIGAIKPEEIALSIMAEIVCLERGGTARFLREVKPVKEEIKEITSELSGERVGGVC